MMVQESFGCSFCNKRGEIFPVKMWNKESYRFFCDEHYKDAVNNEREERDRFIEYYSVPKRRKWLNKESLELWERLSQK